MRASAICLTVILVAGCTTSHGVTGNNVRVVSDAEKDLYKCQFISSVSGFDEYEGNPTVDAENALNDARRKTAELGANALKVVFEDSNIQGSSVSAEALRCNFPD
jgi:hypothetical protein